MAYPLPLLAAAKVALARQIRRAARLPHPPGIATALYRAAAEEIQGVHALDRWTPEAARAALPRLSKVPSPRTPAGALLAASATAARIHAAAAHAAVETTDHELRTLIEIMAENSLALAVRLEGYAAGPEGTPKPIGNTREPAAS